MKPVYTSEEWCAVSSLIQDACEAEEFIDLDELEQSTEEDGNEYEYDFCEEV